MNSQQQNIEANKLTASLIEGKRDSFDISIALELQDLAERIKRKRSISTRAARKIVIGLLCQEVEA